MSDIYPSGPRNVPEGLTRPGSGYRLHAWMSVFGLAVFVILYFSLTAWFGWTAYRLIRAGFESGGEVMMGVLTGLPAAFLSVFMLKALFFIKRGQSDDDMELTPDAEPQLFAFLNQLADEAGAPRPNRVFVSPRVNAAVFYDLSLLNFIFPAKKNLEIGLGLVNALNLGEFKAVLAHEFGHFAQRSMAVGSWVYIAQQVAAHIIAQRDIIDKLIHWISNIDLRIAWVGWIFRLVVWSIRSMMDTAFSLVVMAQRALSREMEFQADLVAVSLTGSDALIHALHKLSAADEAWERALGFLQSEAVDGRASADVFDLQKRIMEKLRIIYDDTGFGRSPSRPDDNAENHRLFKAALATPPKMWATHPENAAREENAKKTYVAADIDDRSAWAVFKDQEKICRDITAALLDGSESTAADPETTRTNLDKGFDKVYLQRKFRGAYLGRSSTRCAADVSDLYGDYAAIQDIDGELSGIYPAALSKDLKKVNKLNEEKHTLEGIREKRLQTGGSVLRYRGKELRRRQLPQVIQAVDARIRKVEASIREHDRRVRSVHLALARRFGKGWEENLLGLLGLLHYAEHCEANLVDVHGYLGNVIAVVTADERVSKSELKRLVRAANQAHDVLAEVHRNAAQVKLGRLVGKQLDSDDWSATLGELELSRATSDNIGEWMDVIDGWLEHAVSAHDALGAAALEQLLKMEAFLAGHHRRKSEIPPAPTAPETPDDYTPLVNGSERKRQTRLDLWDRFYTADGSMAATFRFAVAASVVGAVIFAGLMAGGTTVTIYNGLANRVKVDISGQSEFVSPYQALTTHLPPGKKRVVTAMIKDQMVERFDVETKGGFGHCVYNIGQAAPLVEWTQVYGSASQRPDRFLGTPRWFTTSADVLFTDPPESVKTESDGATRLVLSALNDMLPGDMVDYIENEEEKHALVRSHAVWDRPHSAHLAYWMALASQTDDLQPLLEERLRHFQYDMDAMRIMQDSAQDETARNAVCADHQRLAEQHPDNSNLQYLSIRCRTDEKEKDNGFLQGVKQWPANAWFHLAAGYILAERGDWENADREMAAAMKFSLKFKETLAKDALRIKRLLGTSSIQIQKALANQSVRLSRALRLESDRGLEDSPYRFYALLDKGDLKGAATAAGEMEGGKERCIRLLAASDGATPEMAAAARALDPAEGIDPSTVWIGWGMARKAGKDTRPYEKAAENFQRNAPQVLAALKKVAKKGTYDDLEADLAGTDPSERGHALAAACCLMGPKAPADWKKKANRLLFASERPYFKEN